MTNTGKDEEKDTSKYPIKGRSRQENESESFTDSTPTSSSDENHVQEENKNIEILEDNNGVRIELDKSPTRYKLSEMGESAYWDKLYKTVYAVCVNHHKNDFPKIYSFDDLHDTAVHKIVTHNPKDFCYAYVCKSVEWTAMNLVVKIKKLGSAHAFKAIKWVDELLEKNPEMTPEQAQEIYYNKFEKNRVGKKGKKIKPRVTKNFYLNHLNYELLISLDSPEDSNYIF
jgi:hypothetical protein